MQRSSFRRGVRTALLISLGAALAGCADYSAAVSPVPGVSVTSSAASVSLAEGDRGSVDVTIIRSGGFAGPVTLAVTGLPANVMVEQSENPVTGNTVTVTFAIGGEVASGEYPLTVTATAAGIQPRTLSLVLHVTPRVAVEVTVAYCPVTAPIWLAMQDGDGAWTRVQPTVSGSNVLFRHVFTSNRGGVATVITLENGAQTLLNVLFGTPTELASAGDTNPFDCAASVAKTLFGNVAGLADDEASLVSSGDLLRAPVRQTTPPSFILTGLAGGPQDVLATRTSGPVGGAAVTRLILRRDVDVPDSTRLPLLDFESPEAIAPAVSRVSIIGLGADGANTLSVLRTTHSAMVLSALTNDSHTATRPYFIVPEIKLLASDVQQFHVSTDGPSSVSRSADIYFRTPGDRTVTLGPSLIAPTLSTVSTAPSLRVRAHFVAQSDYDRVTSISYQQLAAPALVSLSMTPSYAQASGGFDLIVPDLMAVGGFDPAWSLRPDLRLTWSAVRLGGTLNFGRNTIPTDGAIQRSAFLQDVFQP